MSNRLRKRSTRSKILHFVKLRGRAAVSDISRAFGITPVAIGRHLRKLRQAGLLKMKLEHRPKGRPAAVCSLTPLGDGLFPKAYDRFSEGLIRTLASIDGAHKVDEVLEKRNEFKINELKPRMHGKGREARVREAVAILTEEGYMAEYSKLNPGTFLIKEHNCAIALIANKYQQVCQGELCLLRSLLGAEIERQSHAATGDPECSYLVKFPRKVSTSGGQEKRRTRSGS